MLRSRVLGHPLGGLNRRARLLRRCRTAEPLERFRPLAIKTHLVVWARKRCRWHRPSWTPRLARAWPWQSGAPMAPRAVWSWARACTCGGLELPLRN